MPGGREDEPTHTLVPCWMIADLLPRSQCTGCFAPADGSQGKPTHTFVPCWMTATLPPRSQCTRCFATGDGSQGVFLIGSMYLIGM